MLGIILFILKIIGIILLSMLLLILLLLGLILFVPVRYRVSGDFYEENCVEGRITWFFHLFHIPVKVDNEGFSFKFLILGIDFLELKKKMKKKTKKKVNQKSKNLDKQVLKDKGTNKANKEDEAMKSEIMDETENKEKNNVQDEKTGQNEDTDRENREIKNKKIKMPEKEEPKENNENIYSKIKTKILNIIEKCKDILEKLSKIQEKKDKIMYFWVSDETVAARGKTFEILKKLWKHIGPRKFSAKIRFGLEYPDKTGMVLAGLSFFYGIYGDKVSFEPDFEEEVLEGTFKLSGKVRLFHLIYYGIRLYRIKRWKEFIKEIGA